MSVRPTPEAITICTFIIIYSDISYEFDIANDDDDDDDSLSQEAKHNNNDKEVQQQKLLHDHIDICQHELSKLVQLFVNPNKNNGKQHAMIRRNNMSFHEILSMITKLEITALVTTIPHISNKIKNIMQLSCKSINSLIDLFDCFRNALLVGSDNSNHVVVDPNSLIGIYIRKYGLGFDELSFEYIGKLWTSLCEYVHSSNISSKKHTPQEEELKHMNKSPSFNNLNSSDIHMADYNNFLNNLSSKERIGALDNLHKYFDYAMMHGQQQQQSVASSFNNNNSKNMMNNNVRMPYAAILLADLHYHFGENVFSIQATKEALRVAHQSNDHECVAYALAWLHYNNNNNNTVSSSSDVTASEEFNSEELLKRCAESALDHNLVSLYSTALLSLTKYHAVSSNHGSSSSSTASNSFNPALLWDTLSAASTRNFDTIKSNNGRNYNSTSIKSSKSEAHSTQITYMSDSIQSMTLLSKQHLVASSIWEIIGHTPLASLSAATALHTHPYQQNKQHALSTQDFAIAIQKIIFSSFYGSCINFILSTLQSDITFNFNTALPSNNIIHSKNINVDKRSKKRTPIKRSNTIFQKCLMQLHNLKRKHAMNHSSNDIWIHSVILLLHQWSLYRGEFHNAYATTFLLQSYPLPNNKTDQSIEIQIQSMRCLTLNYIYSKSWEKAIILTKKLCNISKDACLHPYHAQFLLQHASIHIQCSPKKAMISLPIVLHCILLCKQYSMDSIHASALFVMSKIHLFSNNAHKAQTLLKASMSTILQHSSIEVQGDAWLTLSKCYMTRAAANTAASTQKKKTFKLYLLALTHLQQGIDLFTKIQDLFHLRECYYLQARIYHFLSSANNNSNSSNNNSFISKRNVAASKFQEMVILLKENGKKKTGFDLLLSLVDSNYLEKLSLR